VFIYDNSSKYVEIKCCKNNHVSLSVTNYFNRMDDMMKWLTVSAWDISMAIVVSLCRQGQRWPTCVHSRDLAVER